MIPVGIEWPGETVSWVLRSSVEATLLAAVVLLVQWLFRDRLAARWQFALWWLVVIRLLMPFSVQTPVSVLNLVGGENDPVAQSVEGPISFAEPSQSPDSQPSPEVASSSKTPIRGQAGLSWRTTALSIWLGGAFFCGAYVIVLTWKRQRQVRSFPTVSDKNVLSILASCQREMGIRGRLEVRESPESSMPALYGLSRPQLLLPRNLTEDLNQAQLRHVFFHELAHLKRWDLSSSWLITVALLAHWFNPFIWWVAGRMHADCELACDELALSFVEENENQSYGMTLVTLLERATKAHPVPGLVGIVETNKPIERRIRMIANFKKKTRWSILAVGLIGAVAGVFLTGAVESKPTLDEEAPTHRGKSLVSWVSQLKRPANTESAKEAVHAIKQIGGDAALYLAHLVRAWDTKLEDTGFYQDVNHAFEILGENVKPAVPVLLEAARRHANDLPNERRRFDFALASLSAAGKSGVGVVDDLLEMTTKKHMEHAVGHIGSTGGALLRAAGTEIPKDVLKHLEHPAFHVQATAALAVVLGTDKEHPNANAILIEALRNDSPPVSTQVLINIGIGPIDNRLQPFKDAIYGLFGSKHRLIRELAAKRFVQALNEPNDKDYLIKACQSPDDRIRRSGARAVLMFVAQASESQSEKQMAALFSQLKPTFATLLADQDPEVLKRALNSLKVFGDKSSELLPKVEQLGQSPNSQLAQQAKEVIETIRKLDKKTEKGNDENQRTAKDFSSEAYKHETAKEYDKALKDFTRAIALNPEFKGAYFSRSSIYAEHKEDHKKAVEDLSKVLELDPDYYSALFNRGLYYQYLEQYDKAIADFTRALDPDTDFSQVAGSKEKSRAHAYHYRGRVYHWFKKDYERAVRDYTQALRLDPAIEMVHYRRGRAYQQLGQYKKASRDFGTAFNRDPDYENLRMSWAWLLATCPEGTIRDGEHALKLIDKVDVLRQEARHMDVKAAALAENGRFNEAVVAQKKAIERLGKDKADLREKMEARLARYERNRPFRMN